MTPALLLPFSSSFSLVAAVAFQAAFSAGSGGCHASSPRRRPDIISTPMLWNSFDRLPPCNMHSRKSNDCEFLIFTDGSAKKKLLNKEGDTQHFDSWAFVSGVQDPDTFSCQGLLSGKLETTLLLASLPGSMASEAAAILLALLFVISEPLLHGKVIDMFLDAGTLRQIMLRSTDGGSMSCVYSLIAGILDYARSVATINITHVFAHELQPWSETVD